VSDHQVFSQVEGRPLRADARRNRARVLAAAEAAFTADGLDVPTEEIARRAGVGIGTVFRHFPTKELLAQAVVEERITQLIDDARASKSGADATEAFFGFFVRMVEQAAMNKALYDALVADTGAALRSLAAVKQELLDVGAELLAHAQRAGDVRGDVTGGDVKALVVGCLAMERESADDAARARMVAVLRAGLLGR